MSICFSRELNEEKEAGAVICGAGPAGWVAAVAAARSGLRTVLIDRYGFAGGTAAAGYVLPISGFYLRGRRVAGDIAYEFARRMEAAGAAAFEFPKGNISFDPEYYKLIAGRMLREAGVEFVSNTYVCGCETSDGPEGKRITHVIAAGKSGMRAFSGRTVIDCTGDADVAAYAGVPMQPDDPERQPMSLCFLLEGVDTSTELLAPYIHHDGKGGRGSRCDPVREFLLGIEDIGDFCGPWFNTVVTGTGAVAVNVTRTDCDATDTAAFAKAEYRLREDMFRITELLRGRFPEFANCRIASSGFNAGVRESRRILGKYTFTRDDLFSGRKLPCPVAGCAHPVDIHAGHGPGQKLTSLGALSFVPFDSMVAGGFPNLIVAGRSVSADPPAFASLRVQGTAMTLGEAAGRAAAFAAERGLPVYSLSENGFSVRTDFE